MTDYKLYNFDHESKHATSFKLEDFKIIISKEHCANLKKLHRSETTTFNHVLEDAAFNPVITKSEPVKGEFVETAILRIDETHNTSSIIYPEETAYKVADDIVLFLSFLTGRTVYLKRHLDKYSSLYYKLKVVNSTFFSFPSASIKGGLNKICQDKISVCFYNTVFCNGVCDMPSLCFYASSSLDVISSKWCQKNSCSKHININFDELNESIKALAKEQLEDASVPSDVIKDITARLNANPQPSAILKLTKFLAAHNLFPESPNKEAEKRLKKLNQMRNIMLHTGNIPTIRDLNFDRQAETAASLTFLMLSIVKVYFATEVFKIDNYLVKEEVKNIRKFFESGIYHDKNVFNESNYEFFKRQEEEWLKNYNIIG